MSSFRSGGGGLAAAVAGHLPILLDERRPSSQLVDPSRAASLFESARAGHPVKIDQGPSTVMAMLECYEPSLIAWRVLSRAAVAFMTVDDEDAISVMKLRANPKHGDPPVVAGESGGVGLAAFLKAAQDPLLRREISLGPNARVFLINTEGATPSPLRRAGR